MQRDVIIIDEALCDGCGLCVPACEEGALRIVNGKARLMSDRLCDGMGACLGHCPRGALRIVRREAEAFDEAAVAGARLAPGAASTPVHAGCPGARQMQFGASAARAASTPCSASAPTSALTHWPVQLRLLSPQSPCLRGAALLVAADCVPVAYAGFHGELLAGRSVVIACPKLDDTRGYVEKLAQMIRENAPAELTVARMEVPCCMGIVQAVVAARDLAGSALPVNEIVIGIQGAVLARRTHPSRSDECRASA